MKYMLLIYAQENGWTTLTPEQQSQGMAAYGAYTEALTAAGVRLASDRLRPIATATKRAHPEWRDQGAGRPLC